MFKNFRWKYGNFEVKKNILLKELKDSYTLIESHIVEKCISAIFKINRPYDPVSIKLPVFYSDLLCVKRNNIYGNFLLCFRENFAEEQFNSLLSKMGTHKKNFPRLPIVVVIGDNRSLRSYEDNFLYILNVTQFERINLFVEKLSKIRITPLKDPSIILSEEEKNSLYFKKEYHVDKP